MKNTNNIKLIMQNYISEYISKCDKDPENKDKYYEELKQFIIEVGSELFNISKEEYNKMSLDDYYSMIYRTNLFNEDRSLAANYLALCNLIMLGKDRKISSITTVDEKGNIVC